MFMKQNDEKKRKQIQSVRYVCVCRAREKMIIHDNNKCN